MTSPASKKLNFFVYSLTNLLADLGRVFATVMLLMWITKMMKKDVGDVICFMVSSI